MLQFMRKHAKFFYVFFFLIIISFIFFYVGPIDKSTSIPLAMIGKDRITMEEYSKTYERVRENHRDQLKEKFNDEMEKKLGLKERVLDMMIDEKILLIAAKDLGIKVSDEELGQIIRSEPAFQRDGVFNKDIYFRVLKSNRMSTEIYESSRKAEFIVVKMKSLIAESVDLTDSELKQIKGGVQEIITARQLKREKAIKSYIEGLKNMIGVKVNTELLS
ncbi:MAG: SurA N-terminal domain-containing protein [Nitrospiraceae bacterium]|nr:SurA N-terminal domain-containing protein [Nitrospiraceae bacterium]